MPLSTVPLHAKALSTDPLGSVSAAVLLLSMELQSCCEAAEAVVGLLPAVRAVVDQTVVEGAAFVRAVVEPSAPPLPNELMSGESLPRELPLSSMSLSVVLSPSVVLSSAPVPRDPSSEASSAEPSTCEAMSCEPPGGSS